MAKIDFLEEINVAIWTEEIDDFKYN